MCSTVSDIHRFFLILLDTTSRKRTDVFPSWASQKPFFWNLVKNSFREYCLQSFKQKYWFLQKFIQILPLKFHRMFLNVFSKKNHPLRVFPQILSEISLEFFLRIFNCNSFRIFLGDFPKYIHTYLYIRLRPVFQKKTLKPGNRKIFGIRMT